MNIRTAKDNTFKITISGKGHGQLKVKCKGKITLKNNEVRLDYKQNNDLIFSLNSGGGGGKNTPAEYGADLFTENKQ